MTMDEMYNAAMAAKAQAAYSYCGMTLVFPVGVRKPKGFPRGELLCETKSVRVYSFNPDKVIAWLDKNGFTPCPAT